MLKPDEIIPITQQELQVMIGAVWRRAISIDGGYPRGGKGTWPTMEHCEKFLAKFDVPRTELPQGDDLDSARRRLLNTFPLNVDRSLMAGWPKSPDDFFGIAQVCVFDVVTHGIEYQDLSLEERIALEERTAPAGKYPEVDLLDKIDWPIFLA